ncbi:hypothetical protein [Paludisphaera rhizosphaerae]|uniref:hypothetical protein n=1 Tax=Paludisphaera rhizosphaerae TaxID=2711216 RepID=UPI0013EB2689|nr:hypothetical protein [Paludisphaera rhizosphaerae]
MHRRAFRPEASHRLEDRSLQSGMGGAAGTVELPAGRLDGILRQVRLSYFLYVRKPNMEQLRNHLQQAVVLVPYGREDGLGEKINDFLHEVHDGIANGAPLPVYTASRQTINLVRSDVYNRVRAGDVVIVSGS